MCFSATGSFALSGVLTGLGVASLARNASRPHRISYDYRQDQSAWVRLLYLVGYVVPVVGPFFVSTAPLARAIGVTLVGSLVATVVVERNALTSVWCFFAAILSALILVVVVKEQHVNAVATAGLANPSRA